nr:TnsD family Tn7-like transposition protein [Nevskia soli]
MHFDPQQLLHAYVRALAHRELVTDSGRIRLAVASPLYVAFVRPFRNLPDMGTLPATEHEAQTDFNRLFRTPRTGTHPLRHLMVILWLFGTWDAFMQAYQVAEPYKITGTLLRNSEIQNDIETFRPRSKQDALVNLMRSKKLSASKAAHAFNVSTHTALNWAALQGLEVSRRPQKLDALHRTELLEALRRGDDVHRLALRFRLSIVTINRQILSEPGLKQARLDVQLEAARRRARRRWIAVCTANPGLGAKAVRLLIPEVFMWLYRHDHPWLNIQKSALVSGRAHNDAHLDWDRRDRDLADAIRKAALSFHLEKPEARITLRQLYQRVPDLRPKIECLARLPLTAASISQALAFYPYPTHQQRLT